MTLYDIDSAMESCVIVDEETGEVVGIDEERLAQLQMERERKMDGVACWIKNLNAEAAAIGEEVRRLTARKRSAENRAESLKRWLSDALNGEKFKTPRCSVSYRASWAVEITDADAVPDVYATYERKLSKSAIGDALKAGEEVPGAERVQRRSMIVR